MATRISVEVKGLDRIARNFGQGDLIVRGAMNRMLRRIGKELRPVLKHHTPRRTGKLANSTVFQIQGAPDRQVLELRQGARSPGGAFYGEFVRKGTSPHVIGPVRAKFLVFNVGGKVIYARQVNHPGTRANKYHVRALRQSRSAIDGIVAEENDKIAADLTR